MQSIPVNQRIRKSLLTAALLCTALIFFVHGSAMYRLQERDYDFIENSPLAILLSEARVIHGNLYFYRDEQFSKAAECYRMAIYTEPSFLDGWIGLAKAELAAEHPEEARRVLASVSPSLAHVSTWKTDELLLAMALDDPSSVGTCLTYLLAHLPHHARESCVLAADFWNGWKEVVPHVGPEGFDQFLKELMSAKEQEAALLLWARMEDEDPPPDEETRLRFCQFLLDSGRIQQAKVVWCGTLSEGCQGIYDGGLEQPPLNTAFGWRLGRHPDVVVERTAKAPFEGDWCLHLGFSGNKNVAFRHVLRIIPVVPGRTCVLKFARKSRNLTTDEGVFLEVTGHGCEGLRVRSRPLLGSNEWSMEELEVRVPEGCEAVALAARRKESLKFDNKISGDYWLDDLEWDDKNPRIELGMVLHGQSPAQY
jgi:hypothetical protein